MKLLFYHGEHHDVMGPTNTLRRNTRANSLFLFSSLLQLRAAKRRSPVLPPARARFLFASGGPRGLGCGGNLRFLDRRCRVGPRLARLGFPGGVGEAAAAAQPWNKSLRPHPRFVGVYSGAGERSVGEELASSGVFARVVSSPDLRSSCVGVLPAMVQPGLDWSSPGSCSGIAKGFVVVEWMESLLLLAVRRQKEWFHGLRCSGCVPSRHAFFVASLCGSSQRLCAMDLLLALGVLLFFFGLGVRRGRGERRRWRRTAVPASTRDPRDSIVIFFSFRVFCVSLWVQLSLLYASSRFLCGLRFVFVRLLV